jgi:preprotein translocase subunit SecG
METVLIVIHLMVVAALVVVVLLQRSEGGALGIGGGGGGGGGFLTGRGQANVLTRATAILAALFFLTSLSLTLLANAKRKPTSVFEDAARTPSQSAPAKPGQKPASKPGSSPSLFEQLKRQDNSTSAPATRPAGSSPAGSSPPKPPAGGQ